MAYTTICGLKCTLFLDYDCNEGDRPLRHLPGYGKIDWLEERLQMILVRPFRKVYNKNSKAYRDLHIDYGKGRSTPFFITTSVIMNSVEVLGSFLRPDKKTKKYRKGEARKNERRFLEFTKRYMPAWTVLVKAPHYRRKRLSRVLWKAFRNALTHDFVLEHAALEDLPGKAKYDFAGVVLRIDGTKFFKDFVKAQKLMFKDVKINPKLQKHFLTRFERLYRC